jgi:hypothetical protein
MGSELVRLTFVTVVVTDLILWQKRPNLNWFSHNQSYIFKRRIWWVLKYISLYEVIIIISIREIPSPQNFLISLCISFTHLSWSYASHYTTTNVFSLSLDTQINLWSTFSLFLASFTQPNYFRVHTCCLVSIVHSIFIEWRSFVNLLVNIWVAPYLGIL